jgi:hypothetical protein
MFLPIGRRQDDPYLRTDRRVRYPNGSIVSARDVSGEAVQLSQNRTVNWNRVRNYLGENTVARIRDSEIEDRPYIPRNVFVMGLASYIRENGMQGEVYFIGLMDKHLCESLTVLSRNAIRMKILVDTHFPCQCRETNWAEVKTVDYYRRGFQRASVYYGLSHPSDPDFHSNANGLLRELERRGYIIDNELKATSYFQLILRRPELIDITIPNARRVNDSFDNLCNDKLRCGAIDKDTENSLKNLMRDMTLEMEEKIGRKNQIVRSVRAGTCGLVERYRDDWGSPNMTVEHAVNEWYTSGHVKHTKPYIEEAVRKMRYEMTRRQIESK